MTSSEYIEKALALLERIASALEKLTGTARETPQPTPPPSGFETAPPGTPRAVPPFTYDEVVEAINGYADAHGHKAAKDLLTSFNVTYIKQLRPEQYPDVMKAFG